MDSMASLTRHCFASSESQVLSWLSAAGGQWLHAISDDLDHLGLDKRACCVQMGAMVMERLWSNGTIF